MSEEARAGATSEVARPTALVTGAGQSGPVDQGVGVGAAIAVALATAGHRVAILDRDAEALAATEHLFDVRGLEAPYLVRGDLRDAEDCRGAVVGVERQLGGVDVLVNSAGVTTAGGFLDLTVEAWDDILSVNLRGAFVMCRSVLPGMIARGSGVILNISSIAGARGVGSAAYGASKAGLDGLTRNLAGEFGKDGVRVNSVMPGFLRTPMAARHGSADAAPEGTAWDVADAVVFLSGPHARWISGVVLPVDAGWLAAGGRP